MKIVGHVVNPATKKWYHLDDSYNIHTCDCKKNHGISLQLSQCECLQVEGKLRDLERNIAKARKELGLLHNETTKEGLKRIKKIK